MSNNRVIIFAWALTILLVSGCDLFDSGNSSSDVATQSDVSPGDGQGLDSADYVAGEEPGTVKWKFLLEDPEWGLEGGDGSVAVGDDGTIYALVYPIGGARLLYSISPDGKANWKFADFDYPEVGTCADPVFSNFSDTIYLVCGIGPGIREFQTFVTAISAQGKKKWTTVFPLIKQGEEFLDNPLSVENMALALRPDKVNGSDRLYIGTTAIVAAGAPATIYIVEQTGNLIETDYEDTQDIVGLAFGPDDNLYVLNRAARLDILSYNLSPLWHFEQPEANTAEGFMAFDNEGRIFVPLTYPAGLQALHFDTIAGGYRQLWFQSSTQAPGPPSLDAAGRLCFVAPGQGIRAVEAADGALVWEDPLYAYNGSGGIAALANGEIVADMSAAQVPFQSDGSRSDWHPPAVTRGVSAVGSDGTLYVFGHRDLETMYSDALYAIRGPSPLAPVWTRQRGDNANTGRYLYSK